MKLDPRTACELTGLAYDFVKKSGDLFMGPGSCTDMMGCIRIFQQIDPEVKFIQTWRCGDTEKVPDTSYRKVREQWYAEMASDEYLDVIPN